MKKLKIKILKFHMKKKLLKEISKKKIDQVSIFEIEDKDFEKKILSTLKKANVTVNILKTPMFLTTREDFSKHLKKVKKPFMATFYKEQRVKYGILVDKNGNPKGGKWSFDEENRKKITEKY